MKNILELPKVILMIAILYLTQSVWHEAKQKPLYLPLFLVWGGGLWCGVMLMLGAL